MTYEVIEKHEPDVLVASITEHAALTDASRVIPAAFETLMGAVAQVGYGAGMPGVVYHEMDPQQPGDIEVFMPVTAAFEPPPGVAVKTLEGGHVATTVHRGPYDQVGDAYQALTDWMHEQGLTPSGPPRELYLNDPNEVGMEEALTEIDWPVN